MQANRSGKSVVVKRVMSKMGLLGRFGKLYSLAVLTFFPDVKTLHGAVVPHDAGVDHALGAFGFKLFRQLLIL